MKPLAIGTVTLAIAIGAHTAARAQTIEKKALNLEGAKKVIAAATAEAKSKNAPGGAIAVVDEGGNLIAVERLDNTFAAGANISDRQSAHGCFVQTSDEIFRRRDQQGPHRDDDPQRFYAAPRRHSNYRRWADHRRSRRQRRSHGAARRRACHRRRECSGDQRRASKVISLTGNLSADFDPFESS